MRKRISDPTMWRWWICVWTAFFVEGALGLRLVSLHIPETVSLGQIVRMSCSYDLENDELYSIKWYRDEVEFYRFVPIDRPPSQFFPLEGIDIDGERSINGTVVIRDVNIETSGTYRCEVSADAPSFQTVSAEAIVNVQEVSDGQSQLSSYSFLVSSLFLMWTALFVGHF